MRTTRWLLIAASLAAFPVARAGGDEVAVGRYEGTAFNSTAQRRGKAILDIVTVRAGKVQAHFAASDGLSGEAWLSGKSVGDTVELSGPLSGLNMTVRATVQPGGRISGGYELTGKRPQAGRLDVTRTGPASPVLVDGDPPLTEDMAVRYIDLFDGLLELDLGADARRGLSELLAEIWRRNDREIIAEVLSNLPLTNGKSVERVKQELGPGVQVTVIELARRTASRNPIDVMLVAAYDRAHPDRIAATRARGFDDLVGTWSRGDALAPQTGLGGLTGISFSEGAMLTIGSDHGFTRALVHEQCDGTGVRCCRVYRLGWRGTVDVEGEVLAFRIAGGVETMTDSCQRARPVQQDIAPHTERLRWSIHPRPGDAFALCWYDRPDQRTCYVRK